MIILRKAVARGQSDLGWLTSYHSFSFASYIDRNHMGLGSLRVLNDDRVAPGAGFETHPHDNMEIISYVLSGALEHKDSMGNGSVIRPGDVQRMSAGTGVTHSEFNHSKDEAVHFLQIWFTPQQRNTPPAYQQKHFSKEQKQGAFCLVASQTGRDGSVALQQDVDMSVALLDGIDAVSYTLDSARKMWVHVARGALCINDVALKEGDGVAVEHESALLFHEANQAEVLIFDIA